jgi:hypothetical protein
VGRIDLAVGSGARRSGRCTRAGLLCRWRHLSLEVREKGSPRNPSPSEANGRDPASATFHARQKQLGANMLTMDAAGDEYRYEISSACV